MKTRLTTLALILGALLQVACGGSKNKGKNTAVPDKYFVLGDPMVMIEGTEQDTTSFLTDDTLANFADYTLAGFTVFVPKVDTAEIDQIDSQEELEDQNSTEDSGLDDAISLYSFTNSGTRAVYQADGQEFAQYPKFIFSKVNGTWDLTALDSDTVTAEHYSLSADKRVFSILFSATDDLGNYLGAVTFTRIDGNQKTMPKLDNSYQYIGGTGVAIPWVGPIKISVCGDLSETDQATFKKSVTDWSVATGDPEGTLGGLTYEVDYVKVGKPFNDVNQHCINVVRDYRLETQVNTAILGVTMPVVDIQNFTIVDSSIFIFYDALKRFGEGYLPTATHEVGHLWGLGHEFTRNARGQILHPSIMGYSGVETITEWDVGAIQALYPK